jgi:hypothetical protein
MPGVFDRLQNQIENKQQEGGITALDLAQLSPPLRKIMRLMLRELELTRPQLDDAMQQMAEGERLSSADLDQALAALTSQFWLIRLGEGAHVSYKVNLRRKAGSTLAKNIWASLDTRLKGSPTDEPPGG